MIKIMDYEKAYKDALERAKNIRFGNPNSATANVVCEEIFPELKESEDEKIRKELMGFVVTNTVSNDQRRIQYLRWLEKKGEQEPAWSEEDEKIIDDLIQTISQYTVFAHREPKEIIQWLKSLKPQPHWKPTEEQMQSLYFAIITYSKKDDCKLTYDGLNSLYDELKKLGDMTNEEKAIELAENISPYDIGGDNAAHYAAKDAALDAMEWKDEQEIQFLHSLLFQSATYHIFDRINKRIKLLKGE